ncbi:hypothetical protein Smp_099910 [Schistosoma mansoni]|uniref:hypothetical protein n=1 Tax=Schistosoma mansoni TaxID=6183 RepID=UPI00022DC150|nr:hypothetical protein Smp_099910 [Schistosoma mansoni]|eukprot:XP_018649301.1 hypothetical protein Smp_099910 [Schistosoma mansoni]
MLDFHEVKLEKKPKCDDKTQDKNGVENKRTTAFEVAKNPTTFEKEKPKCYGKTQDKNCMKKKRTKASEFAKNPTTFEKEKPKCYGKTQDKNCMKKKRTKASESASDSRANKKDNLGNIITEEVNESLKQKKYQQQLFLCHVNEKLKKRWKHCLRGDEKTLHARKKYLESINDKPEAFDVTTYLNIN